MDTENKIDNSALIPKYVPDEAVTLEPCETGGCAITPDWTKSLIMMEVHLETATPEGTLRSAVRILDHCAELGVNGIWLTPIYEKGPGGNGYGNCGPHTIEPSLTATNDTEAGWAALKEFIDLAHDMNIRVLFDIITWGTVSAAPLYKEHPEWYSGEAWGNKAFDWNNEEFVEWFIDVCVKNIIRTGADGYRCDCEPIYTGYKVFNRIREGCLAAGKKILVVAEDGCMRKDCFDFEQDGVLLYDNWSRGDQYMTPKKFYIDELNIVDSVKHGTGIGSSELQKSGKSGSYRFYTFCVSNHDYQYSITNGNRLVIGYQAIFAPFIPLWYLGAEFNMQASAQVIYFTLVDWSRLNINRNFFEDVKRYIKIRRRFPEIFEYWPDDHRNANICSVTATGTGVAAYARYRGNKAVIIVPNNSGSILETRVTIPLKEAEISGYKTYKITDLLNDKQIPLDNNSFMVCIKNENIGVYLAEGRQAKY
jgi:1,4-alpha-glucan branching enzyme